MVQGKGKVLQSFVKILLKNPLTFFLNFLLLLLLFFAIWTPAPLSVPAIDVDGCSLVHSISEMCRNFIRCGDGSLISCHVGNVGNNKLLDDELLDDDDDDEGTVKVISCKEHFMNNLITSKSVFKNFFIIPDTKSFENYRTLREIVSHVRAACSDILLSSFSLLPVNRDHWFHRMLCY